MRAGKLLPIRPLALHQTALVNSRTTPDQKLSPEKPPKVPIILVLDVVLCNILLPKSGFCLSMMSYYAVY